MSSDASAQLCITLFGPPQVARADGSAVALRSRKHLGLLFYLAVEQHRSVSRDTLVALLWPDADEEAARRNLRVALADLRRTLGEDGVPLLQASRNTVQFDPASSHTLDVILFRALLDGSRNHSHDSLQTCAACLAQLKQAVALYSGPFLEGFVLPNSDVFEEWALIEREQLHLAALETLETLAQAAEGRGDHATQCRYARRQIELEPWRELAHAQLIRGLWASGQRSAALEQYHACCRILDAELGLNPSLELTALYDHIRTEANSELLASKSNTHHSSLITHHSPSLPTPLTLFVGRTVELAELNELLDASQTRLLTIVGAGGMGKTRLALELARRRQNIYTDGVAFVALAALRTADELPSAILNALDLPLLGSDHNAALLQALRNKQMLLVLDNFEHLLDGAGLISELLQSTPRIQVIATSRERLNLRGEQRYVIEGMTYESKKPGADNANLAAVRLFVQSARHVQPHFRLDTNELASVLQICRLVLGMPLGLELAASWVELLPVSEIAAQIARSGDFLATNLRDLPERQRSMRGVFDWSWRLLRAEEQQVFRQLSVFRGGFTLDAAQTVAGANLRTVLRLVEKSLVQVSAGRYAIHELLRQFAAEQLDAAQERAAAEQRHSQFFLAFLAQRSERLAGRDPLQATVEIHSELDNIRAAWTYVPHSCIHDLPDSAYALWQFDCGIRLTLEGATTFRLAADHVRSLCTQPGVDHATRSYDQQVISLLLGFQSSLLALSTAYDQALTVAQQAILIGQDSGGVEGETIGQFVAGHAYYRKGHFDDARQRLEQALILIQQLQPTSDLMLDVEWRTEVWLSGVYAGLGDYPSAIAHGNRALQLCRTQGRRFGEVACLANLADVAREMRDYQTARVDYEQVLQLMPEVAYRWGEGATWLELGDMVRLQGEYSLAFDLMRRALARFSEIGEREQHCRAVAYFGRLHCFLGDYAGAQKWLEQAERLLEHVTSPETRVETYGALTIYALHTGAAQQALVYAEQGWQLAREFCNPYTQAQTLVELGHAQAAQQCAEAAATYGQTLERYEHLGHAALGAEPHAGLAVLALAQGDLATALDHTEALLHVLAEHPRAGLDEPFDVYFACYRVLTATSDPRAETLLQGARQLLKDYAKHIFNDAQRQSFLNRWQSDHTLHHPPS